MFVSKTFLVLTLGVFSTILPSMVSATLGYDFLPNPDKACPKDQGIILVDEKNRGGRTHGGKNNKGGNKRHCACVVYKDFYDGKGFQEKPLKDGCHATVVHRWGIPHCRTSCPSGKPRVKREQERIRNSDGSLQVCPKPSVTCPILPQGDGPSKTLETECIFPDADLDNCGGCTSLGQGQSCTAIDGVKATSCVAGQCQVYSCKERFKLVSNPLGTHHKRSKISRDAPVLPARICVPV